MIFYIWGMKREGNREKEDTQSFGDKARKNDVILFLQTMHSLYIYVKNRMTKGCFNMYNKRYKFTEVF